MGDLERDKQQSNAQSEREKLVEELNDKLPWAMCDYGKELVNFIIIDRAKKKLEVLEMWKRSNKSGAIYAFLRQEIIAVKKTLQRAGIDV